MAADIITSRRDLSFTATSDDPGIRSNWSVPHDPRGYVGDTLQIGRRHFQEAAQLATVSELDAFDAIRFAITSPDWNRAPEGTGWGIESGFAEALAAAAIVGLRAMRDGAAAFNIDDARVAIDELTQGQ